MARPRTKNPDLPPCIHFKNGAYYLIKRNQWVHLGRDKEAAIARLPEIDFQSFPEVERLRVILRRKVSLLQFRRGNRSKGRSVPFSITIEYAMNLAESNKWHCAVTGLPMSLEVINERRPYAPSLDRIDSSKGYEDGNCRVVCLAANLAMNVWGESVLIKMGRGITARRNRVLDNSGQLDISPLKTRINRASTD